MSISWSDQILSINGAEIRLSAPIRQVLEFTDLCVVRIDYSNLDREAKARNVYAYDRDGEPAWQIQALPDPGLAVAHTWTNIRAEDDRVFARDSLGQEFEISLEDGCWIPGSGKF